MSKSKIKVELSLRGVNELMKSPEIQAALQRAGDALAQTASVMEKGEAFGVRVHTAPYVAIANVYPDSREAALKNFRHNTLLKAIGAAGLPTTKGGG